MNYKSRKPKRVAQFKKSYWEEKRPVWTFLCPLCSSQRILPHNPNPWNAKNVSRVAISAAFFTLLTWYWFNWKGVVSFIPFWVIFEAAYRARIRASLACPKCTFDPALHQVDSDRAIREVREHWEKKVLEKRPSETPAEPVSGADSQNSTGSDAVEK